MVSNKEKYKMQVVNRKGEVFNVDGDEVPDGCSLRTNIFMLDSGLDDLQREIARSFSRPAQVVDAIGRRSGNRPGHAFVSTSSGVMQDAARDEAYAELVNRSSKSWRTPTADALNEIGGAWTPKPTPDLIPFRPSPDVDAAGVRSDSYKAAVARASNAWKTPAGMSGNSTGSKAAAFNRGWAASYAPYQQGDAAPADLADAAHAALVERQENAWRRA
jgi:hypothetical protein